MLQLWTVLFSCLRMKTGVIAYISGWNYLRKTLWFGSHFIFCRTETDGLRCNACVPWKHPQVEIESRQMSGWRRWQEEDGQTHTFMYPSRPIMKTARPFNWLLLQAVIRESARGLGKSFRSKGVKFHVVLFHGLCFQQLTSRLTSRWLHFTSLTSNVLLDVNDFIISAIIRLCSLAR